ncbi:MAG: hypothetical protein H6855_06505 [Rhodospirillales bacterium]|nr:hypothetical protein [Rhodospirillales bacterium]MCB9965714.1 hypothetical protein [Rhodospirillales bacterium]MCB9980083.1 hypothetical protein [Rhodospirillales bacterium]
MSAPRTPYGIRQDATPRYELFDNAESAWFWFLTAQRAKEDGARFTAGQAETPRPCEPIDILKTVDRLYRHRRLLMDHILVLRHYGRRMCPPDWRRPKEVQASRLWNEAMDRIEVVLIDKGIVAPRPPRHSNWFENMTIYEAAE